MRVGLFTDSLPDLSLQELLAWLEAEAPAIRDLEMGTGGYSPVPHCDPEELHVDGGARSRWLDALTGRRFRLAALNVSGNPLEIESHDRDLRRTIELAPLLGVDRVVCMSGGRSDLSPGGWFPGREEEVDTYVASTVVPYWQEIGREADVHGLRLCFELEPGAIVYNVATFERVAAGVSSLAVNLDPSHLFWQAMDPLAVARRLGGRIGFAHGKDTVIDADRVVIDGALDRRSWRFATVGAGNDVSWWRAFADALRGSGYDEVISIEHEDPTRAPAEGVLEAARVLANALTREPPI